MTFSTRESSAPAGREPGHTVDSAWELTDVIARLRRVLRASIRSDFPWETLPMAQVELMQGLASEPGSRVRDLAERHRLAPNTVSNLIQQMVVAGLVVRSVDPADRRAVTIRLTESGERSLRGWLEAHEARLDDALTTLSQTDRKAIATAVAPLGRLVAQLELIDANRTYGVNRPPARDQLEDGAT